MRLRFPESQIAAIAARYSYSRGETALLDLRPFVHRQGYITKDQLRLLTMWKSPRSAGRIEKNADSFVREITSFALAASDERARIEPLILLDGVMWPTASVILHLFHQEHYPILDFRALWSVSTEVHSPCDFHFWDSYVQFTRRVAAVAETDMRTLDRALWQYSKEHQPPLGVAR